MEVVLPKFGWTMAEATIVEWSKKVGDHVVEGEPLFVIETDKANQDVEAPASGVLIEIRVGEGEVAPVGSVIGLIDVEHAERNTAVIPAAGGDALPPGQPVQRIPLTGMRRVIAKHMTSSLREAAQLTLTTEVDVTKAAKWRPPSVSLTALVVHAAARALARHEALNCTLMSDEIQVWDQRNIGIAVALPEGGLVTPVVRDADLKDVFQLATEINELIEEARGGRLTTKDLADGTFTVTNLGMFGVDAFTPILNVPEVAILGMGRWREKPVAVDGEVTLRTVTTLSLTIDHRVVDGAPGAVFLKSVAERLTQGDFA